MSAACRRRRAGAASAAAVISLRCLPVVAVCVMLIAGSAAAKAPRSAARSCGSVHIDYRPTPQEHYTRMYLTAPPTVACSTARRVMRRYLHADTRACQGSSCYLSFRDGWTCDAGTPGGWPVIQECVRNGRRVEGHVHSKIKGPR
jgi:hypothetical protein